MKKKKIWFFVKLIVGLSLFYYIIRYKLDLSIIKDVNLNWFYIVLALLNSYFIIVLRSLKWQYILKNYYGYYRGFWSLQPILFIGQFFAFFTPSRVGDLIRVKYVKNDIGYAKGFSSVIVDRILDVGGLFFFFVLGFIYLRDEVLDLFKLNLNITLFIIFLAIILFVVFSYFILIKFKEKLITTFFNLKEEITIGSMISIIFLTLLIWFLTFFQLYLAILALQQSILLIDVLAVTAIITLVTLLPITIAGIGLREGSAILLFPIIGLDSNLGVLVSWICLITITLFPAIIGYFFYLTRK